MRNDDITLIIMSCDAFSDLWDGQVQQLNTYWPERPEKAFIVTDKATNRQYPTIRIFSAGEDLEWSERLHAVLQEVHTKYVFFTLDDYFLIDDVPNERINQYISFMDKENYDYIRLFRRRKKWTLEEIQGVPGLRKLDMNTTYAICLYAGLWRTDFMKKVSQDRKNAWRFEVSLTRAGIEYGAKCAICMDKKIYPFLDVVRKGKLLRKASRYFKTHDVYHGNRAVNSFIFELKLGIRTIGSKYAPQWMIRIAKQYMRKRGYHYFSDEA